MPIRRLMLWTIGLPGQCPAAWMCAWVQGSECQWHHLRETKKRPNQYRISDIGSGARLRLRGNIHIHDPGAFFAFDRQITHGGGRSEKQERLPTVRASEPFIISFACLYFITGLFVLQWFAPSFFRGSRLLYITPSQISGYSVVTSCPSGMVARICVNRP